MKSNWFAVLGLTLFMGCAGMSRSCSACNAEAYGSDWVIVQLDLEGEPFRCWKLLDTSITNESQSDGIYWENQDGHLVHISGLYNRVQVHGGNWGQAFEELGLTDESCRYIQSIRYSPAQDGGR